MGDDVSEETSAGRVLGDVGGRGCSLVKAFSTGEKGLTSIDKFATVADQSDRTNLRFQVSVWSGKSEASARSRPIMISDIRIAYLVKYMTGQMSW